MSYVFSTVGRYNVRKTIVPTSFFSHGYWWHREIEAGVFYTSGYGRHRLKWLNDRNKIRPINTWEQFSQMGNWKFPEGWGGGALKKIPSVGEVWTLSGTTYNVQIQYAYKENDLDALFVYQSDKSCQGKNATFQ